MPLDIINRSNNNNNNIHLGYCCQNATALIYVITRTGTITICYYYYYHIYYIYIIYISKVDVHACVFSVIQHEI